MPEISSQLPTRPARLADAHGSAAALDGIGWGLFFVWIGVCLLADLGWPWFFLGTGVLMLAGQAARRWLDRPLELFALVVGACFTLAGLARLLDLRWQGEALPHWLAPGVFIAVGVAIAVTAWRQARRD